jgi:hypothetical protein
MKKLLQKFGQFRDLVNFDTETGRAELIGSENGPAAALDKGVAHSEADGEWMAVYEDDGELYLQRAKERWRLSDPRVRALYWKTFFGSFFILRRGRTILFRKLFGPRSRSREPFDPTFDAIDEMHSDFYAFVASSVRR